MPGMHSSFGAFPATVLTLVLSPAVAAASAAPPPASPHQATRAAHACSRAPVPIVSGSESAKISLVRCDGKAIPAAVDQLSVLDRPVSVPRPKAALEALERVRGAELAPGVRRLDARVVQRVEAVADHFRKDGQALRVVLVPGNRVRTSGRYHASGRAIDLRIDGVPNDDVLAFCKTLADTGCGFYPNEGFVHVDVRDPGTGHVAWIDVSRPGEPAKYVSSWPPADAPGASDAPVEAGQSKSRSGDADTVAVAGESKLPALPAAAAFAPLEDRTSDATPAASTEQVQAKGSVHLRKPAHKRAKGKRRRHRTTPPQSV